jgi:hypothetical protein
MFDVHRGAFFPHGKQSQMVATLLAHQRAVHELAKRGALPDCVLLWWGMGSGKTLGGLLCAAGARRVLVLCDKSLLGQWAAAVAGFHETWRTPGQVVDVKHYQTLTTERVQPARYDVCIVDESHRFRNAFVPGGPKEYATWIRAILKCKRLVYLTGTPVVSDVPVEAAALRQMLRVPAGASGFGARQIFHYDPHADAKKQRHFATVRAETVRVPATLAQCLVYFANRAGKFALDVGGVRYEIQRPVRNTYNSALITAANCPFPSDLAQCPKLVAIVETMAKLATAEGSRQLVYSSRLDTGIKALRELWVRRQGGSDKHVHTIDGSQDAERRHKTINAFNRGKHAQVLFISDAAGRGVDLKGVTAVHLLEPGDRLQEERQVINRAVRYKSHKDKDAVVRVFLYCLTFAAPMAPGPLGRAADALGMFEGERGKANFDKKLADALRALAKKETGGTIDERIVATRARIDDEVQRYLAGLKASLDGGRRPAATTTTLEAVADAAAAGRKLKDAAN